MKSFDESEKHQTYVVEMSVVATVRIPCGPGYASETDDERVLDYAMSSITQRHEVACGRYSDGRSNQIAFAGVFAEVSDDDCEIIERAAEASE